MEKHLVSFANANGGFIILGVKEKKINNKSTGEPEKIIGLNKEDHETRITNIAFSHTQPLINFEVNHIELNSDKDIVIIKVKESFEPIMETKSNKFYIRINDQSLPADYSLVKKLFNKENLIIEKKVNRLFKIIKERLENMKIKRREIFGGYFSYLYELKKVDGENEDKMEFLNRNLTELRELLLIFKEDLKYFGSKEEIPLSFIFEKYVIKNQFIMIPIIYKIAPSDLISTFLSDLKRFCKIYFSIDLV